MTTSWLEIDGPDGRPLPMQQPAPAQAAPVEPQPKTLAEWQAEYQRLTARLGSADLQDHEVADVRREREVALREIARLREEAERQAAAEKAAAEAKAREAVTPKTELPEQEIESHDQYIVGMPSEMAGLIVYTRSRGSDLHEVAPIAEALKGVVDDKDMPEAPSEEVVFTRAVKELRASDIIIKRHKLGGYYLVETIEGEGKPETDVGAMFKYADGEIKLDENCEQDAVKLEIVRAAFRRSYGLIAPKDISVWLIDYIHKRLNATTMNREGGFYFVPRDGVGRFKEIRAALEATTKHRLGEMPTLRVKDGLNDLLASVGDEVDEWINGVRKEMHEGFGPRAARTRIDRGREVMAKVRSYEKLLGTPMQGAVDRIKELVAELEQVTTRGANLEVD